jgi:hypothetical protein
VRANHCAGELQWDLRIYTCTCRHNFAAVLTQIALRALTLTGY